MGFFVHLRCSSLVHNVLNFRNLLWMIFLEVYET